MARKRKRRRRQYGEGVEYVVCRHCRKRFRAVNAFHLLAKHHYDPGHPVEDYKRRFGLLRGRCGESQAKINRGYKEWLDLVGKRWTKSRVLREARALIRRREPLNLATVNRNHGGLVGASYRLFGSWERVLEKLGIPYESVMGRRRWTRWRALKEIRKLGTFVRRAVVERKNPSLVYYTSRHLGGWIKACDAAGVPHPGVRPFIKWTDEMVLERIRARARKGLPVSYHGTLKGDGALVGAAFYRFGTWSRARAQAGVTFVDGRTQRMIWTREKILVTLRANRNARGMVSWTKLKGRFGGLRNAADREFGSPAAALVAAGCRPKATPWWSRQAVLDILKEAHRKYGKVTNQILHRFRNRSRPSPVKPVYRYFGSLDRALKAAGLPKARRGRPPKRSARRA